MGFPPTHLYLVHLIPLAVSPLSAFLWLLCAALALHLVYRVLVMIRARTVSRFELIISRRTEELVRERERMEGLVARVLPAHTVQELQQHGTVSTERYKMVTVLFADIEGFTVITENTNPERLIDLLDRFFFDLDGIVARYNIEKIKTIGDAYMCAGGLPIRNRTNPIDVVLAALEMQRHMRRLNAEMRTQEDAWGLRIGVNTGQVISGVIGRDKLSYDIWGSAVNVASRMESSGQAGKINISGETYFFVRDFFVCTPRGKIPIKNRGNVDMYFVEGIRPELSLGGQGQDPNQQFITRLQLIRLSDLENYVLTLLEEKLPRDLYYHNLKHTVDVYTQVELIGQQEGVSEQELLLLKTAALLHDAGHIIDYQTHEEIGVQMANSILPQYMYTQEQIEQIDALIRATRMPVHPANRLEEIICDADLDYLGRRDYIPVANALYQELHERGMVGELPEWVDVQIAFIEHHQYYTETAKRLREESKQAQLRRLHEWKASLG